MNPTDAIDELDTTLRCWDALSALVGSATRLEMSGDSLALLMMGIIDRQNQAVAVLTEMVCPKRSAGRAATPA